MVPWRVVCLTNNQIQQKLVTVQGNMMRSPNQDKIQLPNHPAEKNNSGVFRKTLSFSSMMEPFTKIVHS